MGCEKLPYTACWYCLVEMLSSYIIFLLAPQKGCYLGAVSHVGEGEEETADWELKLTQRIKQIREKK